MESLTRFIAEYEKYKETYPELRFSFGQIGKTDMWRVEIFAKNLGDRGDAQLVSCLDKERDIVLLKAISMMETIPEKIENLTLYNIAGHRLIKQAVV